MRQLHWRQTILAVQIAEVKDQKQNPTHITTEKSEYFQAFDWMMAFILFLMKKTEKEESHKENFMAVRQLFLEVVKEEREFKFFDAAKEKLGGR